MSELTVGKPGEHEKVTPTPEQNEGYILLDNKVDDDFASRFATDNQKSKEKCNNTIADLFIENFVVKEDSDDDVPDIEVPMLVSQKIEDTGLTFRSIIVGCLIGILVAAMNVNFGLRTGWSTTTTIFHTLILFEHTQTPSDWSLYLNTHIRITICLYLLNRMDARRINFCCNYCNCNF